MQRKKIALISDAWIPQVNGVVSTFQSIIPILEKKGFQIKILHPEMFSNFSYPWYKEIKISFGPVTGNAAIGVPHARDSSITFPKVSVLEGNTNTSASA